MDYFLGKRPTGATTDSKVDLGMIVRDVEELGAQRRSAPHSRQQAWRGSSPLRTSTTASSRRAALSLQVDVTATPKHNNGAIFVQTVADYPLVEAITQNVVKHPVLPDAASRAKLVERRAPNTPRNTPTISTWGCIEWRKATPAREAGQEGYPVRDDRRHQELRRRSRIPGRNLPRPEGGNAGHSHQEQRRDFRGDVGQGQR
jgi:type III restriction enzyme